MTPMDSLEHGLASFVGRQVVCSLAASEEIARASTGAPSPV